MVVVSYGYGAPDYAMSGMLIVRSGVYGFGVMLLELITGGRAYDFSKKLGEQNLISWSCTFLNEGRRFIQLADPLLHGCHPIRAFSQLAVALNHVESNLCPTSWGMAKRTALLHHHHHHNKAASAPVTTIGDGLKS